MVLQVENLQLPLLQHHVMRPFIWNHLVVCSSLLADTFLGGHCTLFQVVVCNIVCIFKELSFGIKQLHTKYEMTVALWDAEPYKVECFEPSPSNNNISNFEINCKCSTLVVFILSRVNKRLVSSFISLYSATFFLFFSFIHRIWFAIAHHVPQVHSWLLNKNKIIEYYLFILLFKLFLLFFRLVVLI